MNPSLSSTVNEIKFPATTIVEKLNVNVVTKRFHIAMELVTIEALGPVRWTFVFDKSKFAKVGKVKTIGVVVKISTEAENKIPSVNVLRASLGEYVSSDVKKILCTIAGEDFSGSLKII